MPALFFHSLEPIVRGGRAAAGLFGPWAALGFVLWAAGVWILLQPMEMRGMMG